MEGLRRIPAVALRGLTVLPGMIIHFDLSRKKSIAAVEQAMMEDQTVLLLTQKDMNVDIPGKDQVFTVGTVAVIRQITKMPNDIVRVLVEGKNRARLRDFTGEVEEYLAADTEELQTVPVTDAMEEEAMVREIRTLFEAYARCYPRVGKSLQSRVQEMNHLEPLIDEIAGNLPIDHLHKQKVLEQYDLTERFMVLSQILVNETEVARVRGELTEKIKSRVEKNQKEYLLREQLHFIREELGEENTVSDAEQFEQDLKKLKASKEVKEKIATEISRFK
ncbi:MAG: LON peptidase substrate-binding domain-containing protein, partial [Lachnospiraceae bacterium]